MSKPNLIVLQGIPGSGKTTYAKRLVHDNPNIDYYSSDDLRVEMFGNIDDQSHNGELFNELQKRIKNSLISGHDVIFDATNINSNRRMNFLKDIKNIDCYKKIIVMAIPFEVCLRRNWSRERKIPDEVITRMYKSWQTPAKWEGWDEIKVVTCDNDSFIKELYKYLGIWNYYKYDQNNPYHTKTLGQHMISVGDYIHNNVEDSDDLLTAAMYHDIGKPFCKSQDNDGVSHYYGHESVGAYDMLARGYNLRVAQLINYHMYPLHWERYDYPERMHEKYRKLWGDEFYKEIIYLHEADNKCS